jgi:hypothetical protein
MFWAGGRPKRGNEPMRADCIRGAAADAPSRAAGDAKLAIAAARHRRYKRWEKLFPIAVGRAFPQSELFTNFPGRNVMTKRTTCGALAALLIGTTAFATTAFADNLAMWVRAGGANAAAHLVDLWNSTHPDTIELTTIPDTQMVARLATGVQANEVPDRVSFVLI